MKKLIFSILFCSVLSLGYSKPIKSDKPSTESKKNLVFVKSNSLIKLDKNQNANLEAKTKKYMTCFSVSCLTACDGSNTVYENSAIIYMLNTLQRYCDWHNAT